MNKRAWSKSSRGFSLIELMVAMLLGLIVLLGVTQILISAKNTYLSQNSSAAMQEDARYVLSKITQEVRMVGMFGCLSSVTDASTAGDFSPAFLAPITYTASSSGGTTSNVLSLTTADVGTAGKAPTWTVQSDCVTTAIAYTGSKTAVTGLINFPVRKVVYTFNGTQLLTTIGSTASVLVNNVQAFNVTFGMATAASPYAITSYTAAPSSPDLIRSVRITLTLTDPKGRAANQTFNVVAALRNRLK